MRLATWVLFGLLLLACSAPGVEEDMGHQIRRVTQTTATSDCIGDPRTPLCALDTLVACFARLDHSLCTRALWRDKGILWTKETAPVTVEYVVAESKVLTTSDIYPGIVTMAGPHQPGEVKFAVLKRGCSASMPKCKEGGWYLTYYWVRQKQNSWLFISWIAEGADT